MNARFYFLLIFLSIAAVQHVAAQKITLEGGVGYNTYSFKKLKEYWKSPDIIYNVAVGPISNYTVYMYPLAMNFNHVQTFPSWWSFNARAGVALSTVSSIGFDFTYNSSGSMAEVNDFSGYVKYSAVMRGYTYSLFYQYTIKSTSAWPLSFSLNAGYVNTQLETRVDYDLSNTIFNPPNSVKKYHANNVSVRPMIGVQHKLISNFSAKLSAGYDLQVYQGRLYDNTDKKKYLTLGKDLHADWSGFRTNLSLIYALK